MSDKETKESAEAGLKETHPVENAATSIKRKLEEGEKTEKQETSEKAVNDNTEPVKKKHKKKRRHHRSKYRDMPSDNENEEDEQEEDDEKPEDDVTDDKLIIDDDVKDDLAEIDTSNIITGRRTRGKVVDYSKVSAAISKDTALEDEDEDEDEDFVLNEKQ